MGKPWYQIDLEDLKPEPLAPRVADTAYKAAARKPSLHVDDPKARNEYEYQQHQAVRDASRAVERLMDPRDITAAEAQRYGYTPADLVWHGKMLPYAQAEADMRVDQFGKGVDGLPKALPDAVLRPVPRMMTGDQHQAAMRDLSASQGPLANDPLEESRRQVEYLDTLPPDQQYMLPSPGKPGNANQNEAFMTIAGQLEARRRALGGAVSMGSPWNVLPGTY